jgi:uncharacterized protein (TIGR02996 family)
MMVAVPPKSRARVKATAEIEFVINAREPALGVGIRVRGDSERDTYNFVNGGERSFKHAYCKLYMKPALVVPPEVRLKLAPPPPPPPPPVKPTVVVAQHSDSKLEKAIASDVGGEAPYRAYAEWLAERGDPRAELIRVQFDRTKKRAAAEAQLFETHGAYLMPPLLAQALERTKRSKGAKCSVEWHGGYLKSVHLARENTPRLRSLDLGAIAVELVDHPSATFLRSLVIEGSGDYSAVIRTIGKRKLVALEELVLPSTRAGNIGVLFSAPRLSRLVIHGGGAKVQKKLTHDALRELVIDTYGTSAIDLDGLLTGYFPALERFEIACSGFNVSAAQLAHLRLDDLAPKLTSLVLRGIEGAESVLDALARSQLRTRLVELVVSATDLDDKLVKANHASFAHVAALVLERPAPGAVVRVERDAAVLEDAPDWESRAAARKIADASKWMALGFDPRRNWLWGEYEGRDHYHVFTAPRGGDHGCECGSAKDPCKHVLALRLLSAREHPFAERTVPDAIVRNASRERPTYGRERDDWNDEW